MNIPSVQLQRTLRIAHAGGLILRLAAVVFALSLGARDLAIHMGLSACVYVLSWWLIRTGRWNAFILVFGVEWPFFVRGWVIAFGWESGFAILHGLLPLSTLLLEHLPLRLRLVMAVAPLLLVLQVLIFVPPTEAMILLSSQAQRVLMAGNTFVFVLLMVGVVVHALRTVEREKSRAESLAESRTRLIANMSHELKTPLAAMLTQLQGTLSRDREPERYRRTLEVLERNTRGLGRLVRRMLDFVSAEDVAVKHSRKPEELRTLLVEVVEEMAPLASTHTVKITLTGPSGLIHETDAELLKVILRNLLANAVRFSPPGGVVRLILAIDPKDVPVITVRDEGAGISENVRPRIFEAFYRADKVRSRDDDTFGLGLAIVAEYVALLGYRIEVETASDQGTAFVVTLGE